MPTAAEILAQKKTQEAGAAAYRGANPHPDPSGWFSGSAGNSTATSPYALPAYDESKIHDLPNGGAPTSVPSPVMQGLQQAATPSDAGTTPPPPGGGGDTGAAPGIPPSQNPVGGGSGGGNMQPSGNLHLPGTPPTWLRPGLGQRSLPGLQAVLQGLKY